MGLTLLVQYSTVIKGTMGRHIFTVWQHIVLLLVIRQYEAKSYRLFVDWLVEAYYLRMNRSPHFTTLQKFTERISGTLLGKIISSFIILTKIGQLLVGIDSSGFKATYTSQYIQKEQNLREEENTSNYH